MRLELRLLRRARRALPGRRAVDHQRPRATSPSSRSGVVLAIMPWNFPFWQVFRFAAPALMAGNTAVLKHASNVPRCALAIEEAARGRPPRGRVPHAAGARRARRRAADRRPARRRGDADRPARSASGRQRGRALKKTVLELGGSDPFIVLADADLDAAATTACAPATRTAARAASPPSASSSRSGVADEFVAKFAEAVKALNVGDPTDRDTNVGPLARGDLRDALQPRWTPR